MDMKLVQRVSDVRWRLPKRGRMNAPGVIHADEALVRAMDDAVARQLQNVASLPGIVDAAHAMPDAHLGYGFPIGGVAAFDSHQGGVVSAGGVGFDIACGVRTLLTTLDAVDVRPGLTKLADALYAAVPAGVGVEGDLRLSDKAMNAMLAGGAAWAVAQGFGSAMDLERTEEGGRMAGADPDCVSPKAKKRQKGQMGTLGSGNHYLEVQVVAEITNEKTAHAWGLRPGQVVVSLHCGSRGLGHQIGTDYLKEMHAQAARHGLRFPDRELACAPIESDLGQRYLGAMRAGVNCALANRQVLSHLARQVIQDLFPGAALPLLFDVSHNTCKEETHPVGGKPRRLFVHRKGATRAFGPGHPDLPPELRHTGQPVLVGGSMGTSSYILAGTGQGPGQAFASANHGAGRGMSRSAAKKRFNGGAVIEALAGQGIVIRARGYKGVAEEAPGAYKDVDAVVAVVHRAGLARPVARLQPMACIKG